MHSRRPTQHRSLWIFAVIETPDLSVEVDATRTTIHSPFAWLRQRVIADCWSWTDPADGKLATSAISFLVIRLDR